MRGALSTVFFIYVLYVLFVELTKSLSGQPARIRNLISGMRWVILVTWMVYPVAYILPRLISNPTTALVARQVGYSIADVLAKPLFGVFAVLIMLIKSREEESI